MSRPATRSCLTCGTSLPVSLRFCSQCGAPSDIEASAPTTYTPSWETPPPPGSYPQIPNTPLFTVSPQQAPPGYHSGVSGQQGYPPLVQGQRPKLVDAWAQQKGFAKWVETRHGCAAGVARLWRGWLPDLEHDACGGQPSPPACHTAQRDAKHEQGHATLRHEAIPALYQYKWKCQNSEQGPVMKGISPHSSHQKATTCVHSLPIWEVVSPLRVSFPGHVLSSDTSVYPLS
jgi:hypothetical protein